MQFHGELTVRVTEPREVAASELYATLLERMNGADPLNRGVVLSCPPGHPGATLVSTIRDRFSDAFTLILVRQDHNNINTAYLGLRNALADFFHAFYHSQSQEEILLFTRALKRTLDERFATLLEFVPEAGASPDESLRADARVFDIEKQMLPLVREVITFLAAYFRKPVFLLVEDLLCMDGPAVTLLVQLLAGTGHDGLSFAGVCRATPGTDAVRHLLEDFYAKNVRLEYLNVQPVPSVALKQLITRELGVEPPDAFVQLWERLGVHDLNGVTPLLVQARETGVLEIAGDAVRWDPVRIEKLVADEHRETLRLRWERLSAKGRSFMVVAACCELDERVLLEWLGGDDKGLEELIREATINQLLTRNDGRLRFLSASVRDMVLRTATPYERSRTHYTIARILYARAGDRDVRTLTDHFNEALQLVRENNEHQLCAALNISSGDASAGQGLLARARHYYTIAAELYSELPWPEVGDALTAAYEKLARLEYQAGEYDSAEHAVDFLLDNVEDVIRRSSLYELKITINNRLGRYRKAVLVLQEALGELDVEMPLEDEKVDDAVAALTSKLEGEPHIGHNQVPVQTIIHQKAIRKLLFVGGMCLHHASSRLMTWGALQIIHRSGDDLAAGEKAIGFVVYGRIHIIANALDTGLDYGMRAVQLNRALDDITLRCRVFGIFAFFILPWQHPVQQSFSFLDEAFAAGRASGDLIGAYVIRTHQLNLQLLCGRPLSEVVAMPFEESDPAHELTYYITHYQKNLVRFLLGESTLFSIPHLQPSWLAATNTIQEEKFYRNYVWSRYYFLFGYYHLAERAAAEADANRKLQEGSLLVPANLMIWSLSISQNWQNLNEQERKEHQAFLADTVSKFRNWADHSPDNFACSYLLLKAEHHRLAGEREDAIVCYRQALEMAGDNLWHKALTAECCFRFFVSFDPASHETAQWLKRASRLYDQWGAFAKVRQLAQQYATLYSTGSTDVQLNIELIQQELSGDLQVESIVKKILVLCTRISGSTHAALFTIEGNSTTRQLGEFALLHHQKNAGIAMSAGDVARHIDDAIRTQHHVVYNAGGESGRDDAMLIVPVTIRDHLSFALCLQSHFAGHRYSDDTVTWIRITLNQGAMAIENARTHEVMLRLNGEIREKMEEKERLMEQIQRQRDEYLRSLELTQNEDRKRIASHLHDSVGSLLSSVKMRLNALQDRIEEVVPEKAVKYRETIGLVDEAVQELRRIVYNMLPVSLSRFGLKETLRTFVDQLNDDQRLAIELQILGLDDRLPEELEMAVYRICQELVQNAIRHGAATSMRLQLIRRNDLINLIVEDNGRGMDAARITKGIGFNTIENKVQLYGGTFTIESAPGRGTMILVDLPTNTKA